MEYREWTREKLVSECRKQGITGYSRLKKDEIVALLVQHQSHPRTSTTDDHLDNGPDDEEEPQEETPTSSSTAFRSPRPFPKPLLKWVGGKTQILEILLSSMPREMNNYREPFVGGGSVLLAVLERVSRGDIRVHGTLFAYDINEPLISLYKNIQNHWEALYDQVHQLVAAFGECVEDNTHLNRKPTTLEEATACKENYYYWIRSEYNRLSAEEKTSILGSAMFLFLNKTCWRGVFRMGPNGFNVPYGNYRHPQIIERDHVQEIHRLLQPVVFACCSFEDAMVTCEPNDFVYLDPPYVPKTRTSFVDYNAGGFSKENHEALFNLVHHYSRGDASTMGVKCAMSNARVPMVLNAFAAAPYRLQTLRCRRAIHSTNPESTTEEVLIHNYS